VGDLLLRALAENIPALAQRVEEEDAALACVNPIS